MLGNFILYIPSLFFHNTQSQSKLSEIRDHFFQHRHSMHRELESQDFSMTCPKLNSSTKSEIIPEFCLLGGLWSFLAPLNSFSSSFKIKLLMSSHTKAWKKSSDSHRITTTWKHKKLCVHISLRTTVRLWLKIIMMIIIISNFFIMPISFQTDF